MRLLLLLLAGCHVSCYMSSGPPTIRTSEEQRATVVKVDVECDHQPYGVTSYEQGTGVLVSGRRVLTAAHLVHCSDIPRVIVTLPNGSHRQFVIERDDLMFGDGKDLARLEINSAETLSVTRPEVTRANGDVTVVTLRGHFAGYLHGTRMDVLGLRLGDSGGPVYQQGALVGIVTAIYSDAQGQVAAEIELVTSGWIP